ncbi:PRK06851 family protein [Viridibacillus sp. YIM B01967]|uniref:PRK06851 family protein n=1 Tax=Viridibacillus soli TaxID=2798301 RepID=A0ABS1H3X3_9BACL|nr:PRK06851 family protein [Viridibacillus soli]MBK3494125.1 PRK06851 family protein [Viridibacillus soli]
MSGTALHYFSGGNTARGYFSLFDSNFTGLEKVFILKGGPGTEKSILMKNIAKDWQEKGYDVELVHCSSDSDSLDGVIFPTLKIGIVDGTEPHVIEPKAPGAIEEYVNLGDAWDSLQLSAKKDEIIQLIKERKEAYDKAYQTYAEALAVHDEWEKIYITNMDFEKLNKVTEQLKTTFFGEIFLNKQANIQHRFLGAATPKGAVDYVPNLTENIRKRYFLKGRPGSGKSTLLKKLASVALNRGFDVEIYHCGFDPNSLDMVILRELDIAIFDSTAPHEYFPDREGDEIVDLYKLAIVPGTDEKYEEQIKKISTRYRNKMNEGTSCLAEAKKSNDKLEGIYQKAVDFTIIVDIQKKIETTLVEFTKETNVD